MNIDKVLNLARNFISSLQLVLGNRYSRISYIEIQVKKLLLELDFIVAFAKQDHPRNFKKALHHWTSSQINQFPYDDLTSVITSDLFCYCQGNSFYNSMIRVKDCFDFIKSDFLDGIEGFQMLCMIEMFYIAVLRLQSECKLLL